MALRFSIWSGFSRSWFPIALAGCLILMIPGLVLFAIHLLGYESEINKRLEESFRLSYHIPIPSWGAATLFIVPAILILLYFLKLKRKPVQVPSTFLWKKSIEDLHVNSLFQWLRNNVLLILQLLVLAALLYAILGPRLHGSGGAGKHYILMIDNSASMATSDTENGSRLEWAKNEALKEIDSASDDDVGMLIVFNSRAEIRQSYTSNREVLRQRVREIEPTQRPTNIEDALNQADSWANQRLTAEQKEYRPDETPEEAQERLKNQGIRAEIHLYSDGRFPDVPDFALGNLDLRYHAAGRVGEKAKNVGIVVLSAARDESDRNTIKLLVQLNNYGGEAVTVQLDVGVRIDGEPGGRVDGPLREPLTIPAMRPKQSAVESSEKTEVPGERTVTFDVRNADYQRDVEVQVSLSNHQDDFPTDDRAWLVVSVARKSRVLVIGPPNPLIRAVFDDEAARDVADVSWMSGADFADENVRKQLYLDPARKGEFDLIVFDRVAPKTEDEMPRANTLFIGALPPTLRIDASKTIEKLFIKTGDAKHPLLRYVDRALPEIGIGSAIRVAAADLPEKTPRLMEAENNVLLMFALSRESHVDVVQTFSLLGSDEKWNTNWPLKPAFPMFWRNLLYTYGNVSDDSTESVLQPGTSKVIRPGGSVDKITVSTPNGDSVPVERSRSRQEFNFQNTDQIGVYRARWDDGERAFAVSLLDSAESNVQPRDAIQIGDIAVSALEKQSRTRELWKWGVVGGLAFLLLEWYVYNRRVLI